MGFSFSFLFFFPLEEFDVLLNMLQPGLFKMTFRITVKFEVQP